MNEENEENAENAENEENAESIAAVVIDALIEVAPELERAEIEPGIDLRQELDIDSMDFLNFLIRLHERFAIEIPEEDYPRLATVDGCVAYIRSKRQC